MSSNVSDGRAASPIGPAVRFISVTPNDGADLPGGASRGLFVGGAGEITVVDASGNTATFTSAAAQYHPLRVARVRATATTATGIVALY